MILDSFNSNCIPPLQIIIVSNSCSNLAHKACITYCQRWMRRELWWAWKNMYWREKRYPFISSFSKTCSCLPNFKTYWESFFISHIWNTFFFIQSKQWPWRNSNSRNFIFSTTFAMDQIYADFWILTLLGENWWPQRWRNFCKFMSYRIGPWGQFCWAPQEEYGHHELGTISSQAYMMTWKPREFFPLSPSPNVSVVH